MQGSGKLIHNFFFCVLFMFFSSAKSWAVATGFNDTLWGISIGAGFGPSFASPLKASFDPIPEIAGTGSTVTDSRRSTLIPARFGLFLSKPLTQIEVYFRHLRNTHEPWYSSGSQSGRGATHFASNGVGGQIGVTLGHTNRFRASVIAQGEYVIQRASLYFTPAGGAEESIRIKSGTPIIGGGLQAEAYLGDLWSLGIFAAYQHGFDAEWSLSEGTTFMGRTHSGKLEDSDGDNIDAKYGGFIVELTLRLAFYK